jgi:hypothetical protein
MDQPDRGRKDRDRNWRGRDRRPYGENGGGGKLALLISSAKYDSQTGLITTIVTAMRGNKPAPSVPVILHVDGTNVDQGVTDASGQVSFLTRNSLPAGEYLIAVRAQGEIASAQQVLKVYDEAPVSSNAPVIEVEYVSQSNPDGFQVALFISVLRGLTPARDVEVDIEGFVGAGRFHTDHRGMIEVGLTILNPKGEQKLFVPYRIIIETPAYATSRVLTLERPEPKRVKSASFSKAIQISPGEYRARATCEDGEGKPVKGAKLSLTGYGEPESLVTDADGVAEFTMRCDPDKRKTIFVIDIPSVAKSEEYNLTGPLKLRKAEAGGAGRSLFGSIFRTNNGRAWVLLGVCLAVMAWWGLEVSALATSYMDQPVAKDLRVEFDRNPVEQSVYQYVDNNQPPVQPAPIKRDHLSFWGFVRLTGLMLVLILAVVIYWPWSRLDELGFFFQTIWDRLSDGSGGMVKDEQPGVLRRFFESYIKRNQQPVVVVAATEGGTVPVAAAAPAHSGGLEKYGHWLAIIPLLIAEVADWFRTLSKAKKE